MHKKNWRKKNVFTLSVKLKKTWSMLFLPYWKQKQKQKNWVHWRMARCSVSSAWFPVRSSWLELSAACSSTLSIHGRGHILYWNEDSNWMPFLISISFSHVSSQFMLFIEIQYCKGSFPRYKTELTFRASKSKNC